MREDVSSLFFNTNQETGEVVLTFEDENGYLWNQETGGKRVFYTDCSKREDEIEVDQTLYKPGFYIGVYDGVDGYAKEVSVNTIQSGEAHAMIVVAKSMSKRNKERGIEIRTDSVEGKREFDVHRAKYKKWVKIDVTVIKGHLQSDDPHASQGADKGNQMAHSWAKRHKPAEQYETDDESNTDSE